ncbi:nicotinamide riboside transporter PnuC [Segatella bryantii]|uniref:nicotinamide riboside transporter PnuC n=1 Tax=Segatella bryantii TaxID=77095 RepID=UPI00241E8640|nr:nicotinamide riboside transporter PnuC [Segatella bryantii]
MEKFLIDHWMDILGTLTGLIYFYQEYKASIYLWITGIIMPVIYIFVYYEAGLFADFGMSIYYTLAAIYGFVAWKLFSNKEHKEVPITHIPKRYILPTIIAFCTLWVGIYLILIHFTNSNVPILDSLGNALSIIGLWALARKYLEQWWIWIVADIELSLLYLYKDLFFTGGLYILYVIISFAGICKWKKIMATQ